MWVDDLLVLRVVCVSVGVGVGWRKFKRAQPMLFATRSWVLPSRNSAKQRLDASYSLSGCRHPTAIDAATCVMREAACVAAITGSLLEVKTRIFASASACSCCCVCLAKARRCVLSGNATLGQKMGPKWAAMLLVGGNRQHVIPSCPVRAKVLLLHRTVTPQVTSSHCTPLQATALSELLRWSQSRLIAQDIHPPSLAELERGRSW